MAALIPDPVGENVAIIANSEKQVVDTEFETPRRQAPLMKQLVAHG